ncbi:sprT-like domain-containing protein Spartan isoform X2 [Rhagoletis pomonella]|uniref:sprT-like domain-containing protein Spartan isoform X2 n=1 Tax=Rhagoletis pomonella TaxID=28610 RepID=UPI00177C1949|nr:sprT-like domain-containing protein Spartan isoform X2 [Rhagoletis pomonella]
MADDPDFLVALEMQRRWNAEPSIDLSSTANSDDSEPEIVNFSMPPPSKKPLRIKRSNPTSNQDEEYLNRTQNLVHPQWEVLDPTPDITALFSAFDDKFFQSRLRCVTLEWSKRMYSCAGICYSRRNRFGMDITIRLSEPLLKLRPRKDLVETMLHEMIHAYCFVLNIREGNGGHGPNFKKVMYAINKVAGTNITVYHTFHDEVDVYKQHWWRCNGSCTNRAPFFGYVKRTSNRAPGPNDQWWAAHQESCGGTFMKIKGPDKPKKQKTSKDTKPATGKDLRTFFPTVDKRISSTPKLSDANNVRSFENGTTGFGGTKGDVKRRRLSNEVSPTQNIPEDKQKNDDWLVLDDEIMLREPTTETIAILSDDESDENDNAMEESGAIEQPSKRSTPLTADERQKAIKQEILEDTADLLDEDIILIDDEYDDNAQESNDLQNISAAAELADTSMIDEFFGDDTMMKDFNRENDVKPSGSRHFPNPNDDIITCPICQGKMKRCLFADHMDGCTGIAIKVAFPKHTLKKLAATSRPVKPTAKSRPSRKEILRNAGYSEQDLINLTSASEEELSSCNTSPPRPNGNSTSNEWSPEDMETRLYRQRNILKSTIQCPNCGQEVEQNTINDHLDDCLSQ